MNGVNRWPYSQNIAVSNRCACNALDCIVRKLYWHDGLTKVATNRAVIVSVRSRLVGMGFLRFSRRLVAIRMMRAFRKMHTTDLSGTRSPRVAVQVTNSAHETIRRLEGQGEDGD